MKKIKIFTIILLILIIPIFLGINEFTIVRSKGKVKAENEYNIEFNIPLKVNEIYIDKGELITVDKKLIKFNIEKFKEKIEYYEVELFETEKIIKILNTILTNSKKTNNQDSMGVYQIQELETDLSYYERKIKGIKLKLNSIFDEFQKNDFIKFDVIFTEDLLKNIELIKSLNSIYLISNTNNGIVKTIYCNPGDLINTDKRIISLIDPKILYIEAKISDNNYKKVKEGSKVKIRSSIDLFKTFDGIVINKSSMIFQENNTQYFIAKIEFENNNKLVPDLNVSLIIK